MEVIRAFSTASVRLSVGPTRHPPVFLEKALFHLPVNPIPISAFSSSQRNLARTKFFAATPSSVSAKSINPDEPELETQPQEENFDWFSQWYPIMPVCDLDKRVPLAKKVMGLDVVVWWDRNESAWKVFHDSCPHRLAPLSEGRIDQWGRLQCVYHGWCFNGSGDCKFIPQAPPDSPPVHTSKKACVAVYPSTLQNDIVWFWPNSDPQYKDILMKKTPPYIPELDDPSYTVSMGNREVPYGHEIMMENSLDPAHFPYAHYGILPGLKPKNRVDADREGGIPLSLSVQKLDMNGFIVNEEEEWKFIPPCVYIFPDTLAAGTKKEQSAPISQRKSLIVYFNAPVSPGNCRLIWAITSNFGPWIDKFFPRWMFHLVRNIVFDSDLYLLHVQEQKIMDVGPSNWQKVCFVPTKSDALVVGFRKWLNKYSGGQIDWGSKFSGSLPPTPPREQLMDRYRTHVLNCRSCSAAYKGLNVFEVALQAISIVLIGIVAATKQSTMSTAARTTLVSMSVLCFAASRWLSVFIYKNFHFHDYNHGLK